MNFENVSNEQKSKVLVKKLHAIEEDIFNHVLECDIDPDLFDEENFMIEFPKITQEATDQYIKHSALYDILVRYFSIKDKIKNLENN